MTPLMFETIAEQTCFGSMANSVKKYCFISRINNKEFLETWPYNYNYWTAGMGLPGNYSWCGASGEVPIQPDNLWEKGQPDFKYGNLVLILISL